MLQHLPVFLIYGYCVVIPVLFNFEPVNLSHRLENTFQPVILPELGTEAVLCQSPVGHHYGRIVIKLQFIDDLNERYIVKGINPVFP